METPKTPQRYCSSMALGLEALTICSKNDKRHQRSCLMTSNPFPPPISAPSFSHISDYIGTESCGDLIKNYQDVINDHLSTSLERFHDQTQISRCSTYHDDKRYQRFKTKKMIKKEYPPPMTSLPFVLKRNSTGDGRLILTKEKVERHEYWEAHRSNGRLTLELVSLNHHDEEEEEEEEEKEIKKVLENHVYQQRGEVVGESSGGVVENDNDDNVVDDEFVHVDVEETLLHATFYSEISVDKESESFDGKTIIAM